MSSIPRTSTDNQTGAPEKQKVVLSRSNESSPAGSYFSVPSDGHPSDVSTIANSPTADISLDSLSYLVGSHSQDRHVRALIGRLKEFSTAKPLKVVIVHGDPSKPNDILPGGKWDEDDFYTVKRAKEALDTLPQFHFTWLCNHDTLIADLKQMKKEDNVDLVLQVIFRSSKSLVVR
jgi:hypothetical protein